MLLTTGRLQARSVPEVEVVVAGELDLIASRLVLAARLLERALHDDGPWSMAYGPLVAPARREVDEGGVRLVADFAPHCWLARPDPVVELRCRGVVVNARPVEDPGDGAFSVSWALSAALVPA